MTQYSPYLIDGRKSTGLFSPRYPIEMLQKGHREQFTLFMLSYLIMQGRPQELADVATLSSLFTRGEDGVLTVNDVLVPAPVKYEQIAGIHGLPYEEWVGDVRTGPDSKSDFNPQDKKDTNPVPSRFGGYCNHGSVLFPTWHRPYMMLIEQAIGDIADIIGSELDKSETIQNGKWTQAAKELRFPYWDWAEAKIAEEGVPPVLWHEKLTVLMPNGVQIDIVNPLTHYPFENGKIPDGFQNEVIAPETGRVVAYFADWLQTYRHSISSPQGRDKLPELMETFKTNVAAWRSTVAHFFALPTDGDPATMWDHFSNHTTQSADLATDYNPASLEGVHDQIHLAVGGNGHMADPDYSAFDPVFFLHHVNCDRLWALWEWCYPDYWMENGYMKKGDNFLTAWTQGQGTWVEVYNEQVLPTSVLAPFRKEDGEYWNSLDTRFLEYESYPKYYTYYDPATEINFRDPGNDAQRAATRAKLQAYYGLDPPATAANLRATQPALFHPPLGDAPAGHSIVHAYRLFRIVARLPEHAFNRSYSLQLYLRESKTLLGVIAVFARPDHSPCAACAGRRAVGSWVRGTIAIPPEHVDQILLAAGLDRPDANESEVVEAIKAALEGVIVDASGNEQAVSVSVFEDGPGDAAVPEDVAPTRVTLLSSSAAHPAGEAQGPFTLAAWIKHGSVFENGWKKSEGYQTV